MIELLSKLHPDELMVVLMVGGGGLAASVLGLGVRITLAIQRYHEQEQASNLILQLLDRGVSPAEITAILQAIGLEQPPEARTSRLHRLRRALGVQR